ncbi:hypothetical protein ABZ131_20990 [Providencia rettgeri]
MTQEKILITDKIRTKAKFMLMASPFSEFISIANTLELAEKFAVIDNERPNRRLRKVAKVLLKTCKLDEMRRLLTQLSNSPDTEKAYKSILSYRDSFVKSAEDRVASMNLYIGGDLDELVAQGVPVSELTKKIAEFRNQTFTKVA